MGVGRLFKKVNIILLLQFLFFNFIYINSMTSVRCINEMPLELIEKIISCFLGDFPDNKSDFIKQYNLLLNLRLVDKALKNFIDNFFEYQLIFNKFEDHLLNKIKNKSLCLNDELHLAVFTGSKKYFQEICVSDIKISKEEIIELLIHVLDVAQVKYPDLTLVLMKKFTQDDAIFKVIKRELKAFDQNQIEKLNYFMQIYADNNKLSFFVNRWEDIKISRNFLKFVPSFVWLIALGNLTEFCKQPKCIFQISLHEYKKINEQLAVSSFLFIFTAIYLLEKLDKNIYNTDKEKIIFYGLTLTLSYFIVYGLKTEWGFI